MLVVGSFLFTVAQMLRGGAIRESFNELKAGAFPVILGGLVIGLIVTVLSIYVIGRMDASHQLDDIEAIESFYGLEFSDEMIEEGVIPWSSSMPVTLINVRQVIGTTGDTVVLDTVELRREDNLVTVFVPSQSNLVELKRLI